MEIMTHIFIIKEGFPDGFKAFEEDIASLSYTITKGEEHEIGRKGSPGVREIRFYNITVKDCFKDEFLTDMRSISMFNTAEFEQDVKGNDSYTLHGNTKQGFKIGLFRRMVQYFFSLLNIKPIDLTQYPEGSTRLNDIAKEKGRGWHGKHIVVGELPDGYWQRGTQKEGRERT